MISIKRGVFFLALIIFFSSLDGRKEAKENQGLTEAGEFGRVCVGVENVPGKTSLPRQGPCLDTRKEAKEDQGLTEAGEDGRIRVGVENGVLFSSLRRSLTDICLVGASISLRVRFFCRRF